MSDIVERRKLAAAEKVVEAVRRWVDIDDDSDPRFAIYEIHDALNAYDAARGGDDE